MARPPPTNIPLVAKEPCKEPCFIASPDTKDTWMKRKWSEVSSPGTWRIIPGLVSGYDHPPFTLGKDTTRSLEDLVTIFTSPGMILQIPKRYPGERAPIRTRIMMGWGLFHAEWGLSNFEPWYPCDMPRSLENMRQSSLMDWMVMIYPPKV